MAWHSWPEADRQRVAVARDADVDDVAVGGVGAGDERRHAAVHAVEAVRLAQEVGRRLRRAADARELRHPVRRNRQLPERLDDRRGDRVVPAAGAERRDRALRSRAASGRSRSSAAPDGGPWAWRCRSCRFLQLGLDARRSRGARSSGSRRSSAPTRASRPARRSRASAGCAAAPSRFCSTTKLTSCDSRNAGTSSPNGKPRTRM